MKLPLKILRYNTGTDKEAFIGFKKEFDAVIFNATIVAYSGSAIADLVSVHKNQYIIDPQTHIFQHHISAVQKKNKTGLPSIKKSIQQYLDNMPELLKQIMLNECRTPYIDEVENSIDELIDKVYDFEKNYVNSFITKKEYDKYLKFAGVGPFPKMLIAPYFMLKKEYDKFTNEKWLRLNKYCIEKYIKKNTDEFVLAAQLVLDKEILLKSEYIELLERTYSVEGYEFIFLWIDDFDSFSVNNDLRVAFNKLMELFTSIGKKIIMAYGGYDSILLCNKEIKNRLYGVAQSVGYGESREITPVGGGFPINKYYFLPIHRRLKFDEAAYILNHKGYFSKRKSPSEYAKDYYQNICNCEQCQAIIKDNIDNFDCYNESISFQINRKFGKVSRNRPTTNATLIAAMHFLYCKIKEWDEVNSKPLKDLVMDLKKGASSYSPDLCKDIESWCNIYAR